MNKKRFQFKDLNIIENVKELSEKIRTTFEEPKYHLIRVPNKKLEKQENVIKNFKDIFETEKFRYNEDYLKIKKKDINELLEKKPNRHTFVFYCEILRCAKTQCKKYIGVSYERFVGSPNDSTMIQGTIGRLTGYDDNGESICFTNIDSLIHYENLWTGQYELLKKELFGIQIPQNITKVDNMTYSTGTFNSTKFIAELSENCSEPVKKDRGELNHQEIHGEKGEEEGIKWFVKNLKEKIK